LGESDARKQVTHYIYLFYIQLKLTDDSAQMFAEELFHEAFAKDHRSRYAWDKFRQGILVYGGSRDEREVLEEFLGRAPTSDALIQNLCIQSWLRNS
jgi:Peptidase family M3